MIKGILSIAILAIATTGFVGFRYASPGTQSYEVTYKVVCDECNVTYRNEKGQSAEVEGVKKEWKYQFVGNAGQFVYVAATNKDGLPVKVVISRGGQPVIDGESVNKDIDARAGIILDTAE